ncbi:hypothetical protein [Pseudoflavitalea rhizosphaerae]|uniref:hypothetical protein n=1 Tax=Pseudoflavitalea rhizosphaerae TaxID=1884793 RepID=UPI000F8C864B|nr:hypothetical protein [Pseudoflavitalea rhizosphaerae]
MKTFYRAELFAIALIYLFQFANKSPEQKILGIDKMIIFSAFGFYSLVITILEYYFIRKGISNGTIVLNANSRTDFRIGAVLFVGAALLIFWNKTINSTNYALNILFGLVLLSKAIFCGILVWKIKHK